MMYQAGEAVVYSTHGVCTVIGLEKRSVGGKMTEYYVLEPLEQTAARYYVPTQNPVAAGKLRKLLSAQELNEILHSPEVHANVWIPDEARRKQHYRELIMSGDRAAIFTMIHTLHRHKKLQAESGRKFHIIDEVFLREAQKLLSGEFSVVLGIPAEEVSSYVLKAMAE